jgi:hypothetical protein
MRSARPVSSVCSSQSTVCSNDADGCESPETEGTSSGRRQIDHTTAYEWTDRPLLLFVTATLVPNGRPRMHQAALAQQGRGIRFPSSRIVRQIAQLNGISCAAHCALTGSPRQLHSRAPIDDRWGHLRLSDLRPYPLLPRTQADRVSFRHRLRGSIFLSPERRVSDRDCCARRIG